MTPLPADSPASPAVAPPSSQWRVRVLGDDHVRHRLPSPTPVDARSELMPLTKLGRCCCECGLEVEREDAQEARIALVARRTG